MPFLGSGEQKPARDSGYSGWPLGAVGHSGRSRPCVPTMATRRASCETVFAPYRFHNELLAEPEVASKLPSIAANARHSSQLS